MKKISKIWRVKSEEMGILKEFNSERDMESFLMNNPAIVGCRHGLIRQQISTTKGSGGEGRIDLIGVGEDEEGTKLLVFELKNGEINLEAVKQLEDYLKGWEKIKPHIYEWFQKLKEEGKVSKEIDDEIIENPIGILIGSQFLPEVISKVQESQYKNSIRGLRLARFQSNIESEYYVVVEDQIGDIFQNSPVNRINPKNLFSSKKISESDIFYFCDDKGKIYENFGCKVLNEIGPSHSFIIKVEKIETYDKIEIPKWGKNRSEYEMIKFPIKLTAKTCSLALHYLFRVYDERELFDKYWVLGDGNFVRKNDGKSLWQIREEYKKEKKE